MKSLLTTPLVLAAIPSTIGIALAAVVSATGAASPLPTEYALFAVGSATLVLFAIASIRSPRGNEDARLLARRLGEQGRSIPQIARSMKLSQDAVRGLLGPDTSAGRRIVDGNNCRKRRPRAQAR